MLKLEQRNYYTALTWNRSNSNRELANILPCNWLQIHFDHPAESRAQIKMATIVYSLITSLQKYQFTTAQWISFVGYIGSHRTHGSITPPTNVINTRTYRVCSLECQMSVNTLCKLHIPMLMCGYHLTSNYYINNSMWLGNYWARMIVSYTSNERCYACNLCTFQELNKLVYCNCTNSASGLAFLIDYLSN